MKSGTRDVNISNRLLPVGVTQQQITTLVALLKSDLTGPKGATGAAGATGATGAAGEDLPPTVAEAQETLDQDFDNLLIWIVDTFKEIPPGLEDRYSRAITERT